MARHSKDIIDRETDARFWAQTAYKVGRRLDPSDPTDRKMMPIWIDIWGKVRREDAAGDLVLTYNHPDVERGLSDSEIAGHISDSHADVASSTPDPELARAHAAAAAQAATIASSRARVAAFDQPPTVSPSVADAVAASVARDAGVPGRPSAVADLHPGHPAIASEAAQPILPPEVAAQATAAPARPAPAPTSPTGPTPPMPSMAPPMAPPRGAGAQLAVARAMDTPSVAIGVHEDASARAASGAPLGSMHPQTVAQIRALARRFAADSMGGFIGVSYSPQGQWSVPLFESPAEAALWYERLTDSPDAFRYAAHFDKTSADTWPGPVRELFGSSRTLGDAARPEVRKRVPYVAIAAAGAAVVGLTAVLATRRRRSSGSARGRPTKSSTTPTVQIFEVGKR